VISRSGERLVLVKGVSEPAGEPLGGVGYVSGHVPFLLLVESRNASFS